MSSLFEARREQSVYTDAPMPRAAERAPGQGGLAALCGAVSVALAAACAHGDDAPFTSPSNSRGDRVAATCVTCHHPSNAHIPSLTNVSGALIAAQAEAADTIMHRLVAGLTQEDIEAVAEALARGRGEAP